MQKQTKNGNGHVEQPHNIESEQVVGQKIEIAPLTRNTLLLTLKGNSPLIMNRMGNKVGQLLEGMMNVEPTTKKKNRKAKDPEGDFLNALHVISGKPKAVKRGGKTVAIGAEFGIPAGGVKDAILGGCLHMGRAVSKTLAQSAFFVAPDDANGNYVRLHHSAPPFMRMDVVRVGPWSNRVPDIRFRPEFTDWWLEITIQYNPAVISPQTIANLANHGGFACGLGEWRMQKGGNYGRFSVADKRSMKQ